MEDEKNKLDLIQIKSFMQTKEVEKIKNLEKQKYTADTVDHAVPTDLDLTMRS